MELESKSMSLLSSVKFCDEPKRVTNCSENSVEQNSDIDEEHLNSIINAVRNIKTKPLVHLYTLDVKDLGIVTADIKEFSDIAYANSYSAKIQVLSCEANFVCKHENKKSKKAKYLQGSPKFEKIKVLQHFTDVTALSYTNGNLLMSCCVDGTVKAWSRNYQLVHSYSDIISSLSDIHASPRMDYFVTSSLTGLRNYEGKVVYGASLFSFLRNDPIMSFTGHSSGIQCVRFHANGKYIATTSLDNTIKMWDTQTSRSVRTFQDEIQECSQLRKIAFSPDGKYLASTYFGSVKIWDLASGQLVKTLGSANPNHSFYNICYSKSGEELAAGGADGVLKVWNTKDFAASSSFVKASDELLDSHTINQPIFAIQNCYNTFSCVSALTR